MELNNTNNETVAEIIMPSQNRAYKIIIAVLAVAIIAAGALLLIQNFSTPKVPTTLGSQIFPTQGAGDDTVIMEVYQDEDGNVTLNEITPEKE